MIIVFSASQYNSLKRKGWTVRNISKVPDNWLRRQKVKVNDLNANVDVLMNSDETFFQFYPEVKHAVAPVGAKRVGSTNETNEKKGLTGMLGMELLSSLFLTPFLIFDGATEGRLSKQWDK